MIVETYVRPIGRVTRMPSRISATADKLLRAGGREDVGFAALEILHRHADGSVERRILSPQEARQEISRGGAIADRIGLALTAIGRPRPPIAGLSLDRPRIMGIVNVTPDSFSDGGSFSSSRDAIAHARRLDDEGADIVDIGGESTRPGSDPVPIEEELRRVIPVLEGLAGRVRARLSVDTRKAEVMRRAAAAGAHILNDVSALTFDAAAMQVAAESRLPVVLMHAQGDPKTMQTAPHYANVLLDVYDMLAARIAACLRAGITLDRIVVDPGIGFGKTLEHNLELLAGSSVFLSLGCPVLIGASRKRMIGTLTGAVDAADRVSGSIAAALESVMQGAAIVRVHDVAATRQALTVWEAATLGMPPPGTRV